MILGFLSGLSSFTNIFNDYQCQILITFFTSIPILYIISLWIYISTLNNRIRSLNKKTKKLRNKLKNKSKKHKKLKLNRDGLINQLRIDQNDKLALKQEISSNYSIIYLLSARLPQEEVSNILEKIQSKEMQDIGYENENSKNN